MVMEWSGRTLVGRFLGRTTRPFRPRRQLSRFPADHRPWAAHTTKPVVFSSPSNIIAIARPTPGRADSAAGKAKATRLVVEDSVRWPGLLGSQRNLQGRLTKATVTTTTTSTWGVRPFARRIKVGEAGIIGYTLHCITKPRSRKGLRYCSGSEAVCAVRYGECVKVHLSTFSCKSNASL